MGEERITKRRPYTISKSFKKYLLASIATMAVMNINGIIDAILMGQILGPDSLSAIQTSMPVVSFLACIGILVTNGAALILPEVFGKRDYDSVNRILCVCLAANLAEGVLIAAFCGGLSRIFALLLCVDPGLAPGVRSYTLVLLAGSVLLLLQNDAAILVDVLGSPLTVTISMAVSVVVNLTCDILFTKVFGLGIGGAALATLTGALVSLVLLLRFFYARRETFHLKWNLSRWGKTLSGVIQRSIPGVVSSLGTMLLTVLCNSFVQKSLGADGMFAMSVGYSLVSFGSMISGGIGAAFMGIGGMLRTQEDYKGFSMLVRKGMGLSLVIACVINLIGWLFPDRLAVLYGADSDVLIAISRSALPLICLFILAISIITPLCVVYQVNARGLLATLGSLSLLAFAAVGLLAAQRLFAPSRIWFAFPIAAVLSVTFVLAAAALSRPRTKGQTEPVTLIPRTGPEDAPKLDVSIPCSEEGIREGLSVLKAFLEQNADPEKKTVVMHCLEELLINIAVYTGKEKRQFFDLLVRKEKEGLYVCIKDCGVPFDPVNCREEKWKNGLAILHHYGKDVSYSYSFGLNMTVLRF